jgi:hypothetical protein
MKIALIYTPRCGSTSIFEYFKVLKPNYICYKEPWFTTVNDGIIIDYDKIISEDNIFIKSTYKHLIVPIEKILNDFDRVIFLSRKDKRKMVESLINANNGFNYFDRSKRKYWTEYMDEEEINQKIQMYEEIDKTLFDLSVKYGNKMFYYEDLYYNDLSPILNELDLDLVQPYFDNILDQKNKYRIEGELETKKHITIL